MALLRRKDLEAKGLTAEQIDYIVTESNRALAADYMPKSSLQEEIDKAIKENPPTVDVTQTDEYKQVVSERDMLRAIGGEEFAAVKPKFRETVYKMLDQGENAPSLEEQLGAVREKYEEYFVASEEPPKNTPVFSKPAGSTHVNETEEDKLFAKMMENWDKH